MEPSSSACGQRPAWSLTGGWRSHYYKERRVQKWLIFRAYQDSQTLTSVPRSRTELPGTFPLIAWLEASAAADLRDMSMARNILKNSRNRVANQHWATSSLLQDTALSLSVTSSFYSHLWIIYFPKRWKSEPPVQSPCVCLGLTSFFVTHNCSLEGNMPENKTKQKKTFQIVPVVLFWVLPPQLCQHLSYNSSNSGQADKKAKPCERTNPEQERKLSNRNVHSTDI